MQKPKNQKQHDSELTTYVLYSIDDTREKPVSRLFIAVPMPAQMPSTYDIQATFNSDMDEFHAAEDFDRMIQIICESDKNAAMVTRLDTGYVVGIFDAQSFRVTKSSCIVDMESLTDLITQETKIRKAA